MLTVGQLARIFNVSAKTLRYYDTVELFTPAKVGEDNQYRFYSPDQFPELRRILHLRSLGLGIEVIRDLKRNHNLDNPDEVRRLLLAHADEVREEIARQQKRLAAIERVVEYMEQTGGFHMELKLVGVLPNHRSENSKLAAEVVDVIRTGDVDRLKQLLAENPGLAKARVIGIEENSNNSRTLLHIATDWPGHFPNGTAIVTALIEAGADVNARFIGPHTETPLHWAASCDDVEVLDVLLDAGADIEAPGAVIAGGSPLNDAVAFGQWRAAQRLVERGARTNLWHAAALGLMDRVEAFFDGSTRPAPDEVTQAFWLACHGGQQQTAAFLLEQGADINWIGYDRLTPLDAALRSDANDELIDWLRSHGARSTGEVE